MADEISTIGVKLTLNAQDFMAGMGAATTVTNDFVAAAKDASTVAGPAGAGRKSSSKSSAAQNMGVSVDLSVSAASIRKLRQQIIEGLGTIPITVTAQMGKTAQGAAESVVAAQVTPVVGTRTGAAHAVRSSVKQNLPQRATGGPVWPGQDFVVGERRPEVVRFAHRGTVIPDMDALRRRELAAARREADKQREHELRMETLKRKPVGYRFESQWVPWRGSDAPPAMRVDAYRGREHVGDATFEQMQRNGEFLRRGDWYPEVSVVRPAHQRRGVGSWMYAEAERRIGQPVRPSPVQSRYAQGMWSDPRRPFGGDRDAVPGQEGMFWPARRWPHRAGGGPVEGPLMRRIREAREGPSRPPQMPQEPRGGQQPSQGPWEPEWRRWTRENRQAKDLTERSGGGRVRPSRSLEARALRMFGETDYIGEAGYITPSGRMLDFSGRHEAAGYRWDRASGRYVPESRRHPEDYLSGSRNVDHRQVWPLFPNLRDEPERFGGGPSAMERMMQRGFVRVFSADPGEGQFMGSIGKPLTAAQERTILGSMSEWGQSRLTGIMDVHKLMGRKVYGVGESDLDVPATPLRRVMAEANRLAARRRFAGGSVEGIEPNLRGFFAGATKEQRRSGADWYRLWGAKLRKEAGRIGIPAEELTAVAAALSPRNGWPGNFYDAVKFAEAHQAGLPMPQASTFATNWKKAWEILDKGPGALTGLKRKPFSAALLGDINARPMDIWMVRAAKNQLASPNEGPESRILVGQRKEMERVVDQIAQETGFSPRQVQAIIWTAARERGMAAAGTQRHARLRQAGGDVLGFFHGFKPAQGLIPEAFATAEGWAKDPFMAYMAWQGQQQHRRAGGRVGRDIVGKPHLARDFAGKPMAMGIPSWIFNQLGPEGLAGAAWKDAMTRNDSRMAFYARYAGYIPETYHELWGEPFPNFPFAQDEKFSKNLAEQITYGRIIDRKKPKLAASGTRTWLKGDRPISGVETKTRSQSKSYTVTMPDGTKRSVSGSPQMVYDSIGGPRGTLDEAVAAIEKHNAAPPAAAAPEVKARHADEARVTEAVTRIHEEMRAREAERKAEEEAAPGLLAALPGETTEQIAAAWWENAEPWHRLNQHDRYAQKANDLAAERKAAGKPGAVDYHHLKTRLAKSWAAEYEAGARPQFVISDDGGEPRVMRVYDWNDQDRTVTHASWSEELFRPSTVPVEKILPATKTLIDLYEATSQAYKDAGWYDADVKRLIAEARAAIGAGKAPPARRQNKVALDEKGRPIVVGPSGKETLISGMAVSASEQRGWRDFDEDSIREMIEANGDPRILQTVSDRAEARKGYQPGVGRMNAKRLSQEEIAAYLAETEPKLKVGVPTVRVGADAAIGTGLPATVAAAPAAKTRAARGTKRTTGRLSGESKPLTKEQLDALVAKDKAQIDALRATLAGPGPYEAEGWDEGPVKLTGEKAKANLQQHLDALLRRMASTIEISKIHLRDARGYPRVGQAPSEPNVELVTRLEQSIQRMEKERAGYLPADYVPYEPGVDRVGVSQHKFLRREAAKARLERMRARHATVPQHEAPIVAAHEEVLQRAEQRHAAEPPAPPEPPVPPKPVVPTALRTAEEIFDATHDPRRYARKRMEELGLFTVTRRHRAAGGETGAGLYIVNEAGPEAFLTAKDAAKLARVRPDIMARVPGASDGARTGMIQKPAWSLFAPRQQGLIVRREDAHEALHAVRAQGGINLDPNRFRADQERFIPTGPIEPVLRGTRAPEMDAFIAALQAGTVALNAFRTPLTQLTSGPMPRLLENPNVIMAGRPTEHPIGPPTPTPAGAPINMGPGQQPLLTSGPLPADFYAGAPGEGMQQGPVRGLQMPPRNMRLRRGQGLQYVGDLGPRRPLPLIALQPSTGIETTAQYAQIDQRAQEIEAERKTEGAHRGGAAYAGGDLLENLRLQRAGIKQLFPARSPRIAFAQVGQAIFGGGLSQARGQVEINSATANYQRVIKATNPVLEQYRATAVATRESLRGLTKNSTEWRAALVPLRDQEAQFAEAMEKRRGATKKVLDLEDKYAPRAKNVLQSLSSIVLATSAYGIAFSAANAVIQPAIEGTIKASQAWADEILGFTTVTQRVTKSIGTSAQQMGGNVPAAIAQATGAAGFGGAGYMLAQQYLASGVTAKGGGAAAQTGSDIRRAILGAIGGAPQGLMGGYGGIGGGAILGEILGGGKGSAEIMTKDLVAIQSSSQRAQAMAEGKPVRNANGQIVGVPFRPTPQRASDLMDQSRKDMELFSATVKDYNDAGARYAKSLGRADTGMKLVEGATKDQIDAMVQSADANRSLGGAYADWADRAHELADTGVALVDAQGKAVTTLGDATKYWEGVAGGAMVQTQQEFMDQQKRALQGQFQAAQAQTQQQLAVAIPGQLGMQLAAEPFIPAAAGVLPPRMPANVAGIIGGANGIDITKTLAQAQADQDALTAAGKTALESLSEWIGQQPGMNQTFRMPTGEVYGTGRQAFDAFTKEMTTAGSVIADWQNKIVGAQAQQQWAQFSNNLRLSNRAYADALALAGKGGGNAGIMGALERQQTMLGFMLSQKQINFQTALAGFQAPGLTSEERGARQAQAQAEAAIAQQQLNIQKSMFTETARRQVADTGAALNLLKQEQNTQVAVAAAQKAIATQQMKLSQAQAKAQVVQAQAQGNFGAQLSTASTYVSQFGGTIKEATDALRAALGMEPITRERKGGKAAGYLGGFAGGAIFTVGEAGPETVAILRNPRTSSVAPWGMGGGGGGGAGGGPVTVNLYMTVQGDVKDEVTVAKIVRAVEDSFNRKAARLGMRTFVSAAG